MRRTKCLLAGLVVVLLLSSGGNAFAVGNTDLNEIAAFLVYPAILAIGPGQPTAFETYVAVTNAIDKPFTAHFAYINGDENDSFDYCNECNFSFPLTGNDTELLTIRFIPQSGGIEIVAEDGTVSGSCSWPFGMMTVNLEDPITGGVVTDNALLGSEVVVNYVHGFAWSIPAVPFQGKNGGNMDRTFQFNATEYGKFPRVVSADFIAPDLAPGLDLSLVLFTLDFEAGNPLSEPLTNCDIQGYDAAENPFSFPSLNFGCWTVRSLQGPGSEFNYGNLGQQACTQGLNCDTHGWLLADCNVRRPGQAAKPGGVHGAIVQIARTGTRIRRNNPLGPTLPNSAAWARLLFQSVSQGGEMTLQLSGPAAPIGP